MNKIEINKTTDKQLAGMWLTATASYSVLRKGGKVGVESVQNIVDKAIEIFKEIGTRDGVNIREENIQSKFNKELFGIVSGRIEKDSIIKQKYPLSYFGDKLRKIDKDFILEFSEIIKHLKGSILEIGCGAGRAMSIIKDSFSNVNIKGIDISGDIVDEFSKMGFSVKKMDALDLDYPINAFDTTFSIHVMEHVDDMKKAINESIRIAKQKAMHIISIPIDDLKASFENINCKFELTKINDETTLAVFNKSVNEKTLVPLTKYDAPLSDEYTLDNVHEKWGKGFENICVQPLHNGFPLSLQKNMGGGTLIYDTRSPEKVDVSKHFPDLVHELQSMEGDFILDTSIGAIGDDGLPLPEKDFMDYASEETFHKSFTNCHGVKATISIQVSDILFYKGQDLRAKPFSERREILLNLFNANDCKLLEPTKIKVAKTKEMLIEHVKELSNLPGSIGALLKDSNSIYKFDRIDEWARIKNKTIAYLLVHGVHKTIRAGFYYYDVDCLIKKNGLIGDVGSTSYKNIKAKLGDIIKVECSEVIPHNGEDVITVNLMGPQVIGIEKTKTVPDSVSEIIKRADKDNTLQLNPEMRQKLIGLNLVKSEPGMDISEGEEGIGVIQTHERGLSEDQAKFTEFFGKAAIKIKKEEIQVLESILNAQWLTALTNAASGDSDHLRAIVGLVKRELLTNRQRRTFAKVDPVSIHTDFRFQVTKPVKKSFSVGGEGFTPGNQFRENKFFEANNDANVRIFVDFKKSRKGEGEEGLSKCPLVWLEKGEKKPETFEPGQTGATTKNHGRIKVIEKFKFKAGRQEKNFKEFLIEGNILKGRWIMEFSKSKGQWIMSKPNIQHFNGTILKNENRFKVIKDELKQIVYGVVYEPNKLDSHGDYASVEEIESAAHRFMEKYNSINLMHKVKINNKVKVVESFLAPVSFRQNGEQINKGSWVMAVHILDKILWKDVLKGDLDAFSIEGTARAGKPDPEVERQ